MNEVLRIVAVMLAFTTAHASWANLYTVELLQAVLASDETAKQVKKQGEEGFLMTGIEILEVSRVPGSDKVELKFKKFDTQPSEESVRNIIVTTELKFKKNKIKVGIKRQRTDKD